MPNTAFTTPQMAFFSRRRALLTSLVVPVASAWAQRPAPTWRVQVVDQPEPVLQLRAAETDGWLMVGAGGGLRWLRPPAAPLRLAQGIDPGTPVAAAHGLTPANVRKICQRVRATLIRLAETDAHYADMLALPVLAA